MRASIARLVIAATLALTIPGEAYYISTIPVARLCCAQRTLTGKTGGRYGAPLYWERDETTGAWACTEDYPSGPPAALPPPATAPVAAASAAPGADHANALCAADAGAASKDVPEAVPEAGSAEAGADADAGAEPGAEAEGEEAFEQRIQRSMVLVEVDIPPVCLIDGVHSRCFAGAASRCNATGRLKGQTTLRFFAGHD